MTTTTISNHSTIAATVSAGDILTITKSGEILLPTATAGVAGGVGVTLNAGSLFNSGLVFGGDGGVGAIGYEGFNVYRGGAGAVGGAGAACANGYVDVRPAAFISGGTGGAGGAGGNSAFEPGAGGAGGSGGAGAALTSGSANNAGQIVGGTGGAGGAGGAGGVPGSGGGAGGSGGAGVALTSGSANNAGQIVGGTGGVGGAGAATGAALARGSGGGAGGAGGAGVSLTSSTLNNSGMIVGGGGGVGGAGGSSSLYGGTGGVGGSGAAGVLLSASVLVNRGLIRGASGGAGGAGGVKYGSAGQFGQPAAGVLAAGPGTITNLSGGTITGYIAIQDAGSGGLTVNNSGSILGVSEAIVFTHASDRLIVASGASFNQAIVGGGGTLELGGGADTITGLGATGTISGSASGTFSNFGSYAVDAGVTATFTGANTVGASETPTDNGSMTVAGMLVDAGRIAVSGGAHGDYAGLNFTGPQTLAGGGAVSLNATGYIGGTGSLTNADTIEGGGFIKGVTLTNDGTIDNNVGRMILNTGGTVTNDGLVEATGAGNLVVRNSTIDSAGGAVIDAIRIQLSGGTLVDGALTIDAGALLINDALGGTVNLAGGTVSNAGTIEATAGGLTIEGAVSGGGVARLVGKGVLEIDGALSENVVFAVGSTGTFVLGDTVDFKGRIIALSNNAANHIDLKTLAFDPTDTAVFKGSAQGGILTIYNSSNVALASFTLSGHYLGSEFTLASDGAAGGTLITASLKTAQLTQAMAAFGAGGPVSAAATAPTAMSASIQLARPG